MNGTVLNGDSALDNDQDGRARKRFKREDELEKELDERDQEVFPVEPISGPSDLYLDTIDRSLLDFDFERICSVSLSTINVYACLICGKYFTGRGKQSPAYAHSFNEDHHVFINLETLQVYILPDLYLVDDPSIQDIRTLLRPVHSDADLQLLTTGKIEGIDLQKYPYLPGFVGLNNMSQTSFINVVLQAILHVIPIRDYFVRESQAGRLDDKSELVKRFGMLCRKFWNPHLFKAQVSPHEFLQEVTVASGRQFRITQAGDPLEFLSWLLNALHRDLGGHPKRPKTSIIHAAFQGQVRIEDQAFLIKTASVDDPMQGSSKPRFDLDRTVVSTVSPFLFLSIDLPPPPVFQDAVEKNIIPQVPISAILAKYDGKTAQHVPAKGLRRYKIKQLPPVLIMNFKRFAKNNFVEEKNPTIVNYPLRHLDMRDYLDDPSEKVSTYYNLVANITHTSAAGTAREETIWKVHVHTQCENEADEKWFQIQDLIVEEVNKQVIFLGETYLQIWERKLQPNESHNLALDQKAIVSRPKTTKEKMAKSVPTPEDIAKRQKEHLIGVRLGKMRVEKGDSAGLEL